MSPPRWMTECGEARVPVGSLTATPMRRVPRSTPTTVIETPPAAAAMTRSLCPLVRSRARSQNSELGPHLVEGFVQPRRVLPSRQGQVGLLGAAAANGAGRLGDEVARHQLAALG